VLSPPALEDLVEKVPRQTGPGDTSMNERTILFLLLFALPACPNDGDASGDTGNASDDVETSESSSGSSSGDTEPLEIAGEYDDEFGGHHQITDTTWIYEMDDFGATTNLMQHDNEAGWVAGEDADNAGTFKRFDWTYDADDVLWYCNTVFDATSLEAAIAEPLADADDPATGGCGGFPWTMLTPA
jgi:hypothetical protein